MVSKEWTNIVFVIVVLYFFSIEKVSCQDLSTIAQQDLLQINGNISIDQILAPQLIKNTEYGRKLYSYFITGGLNTSLYGISMPLTFSYTNENLGFTHPFSFNQFGAQPSYKWIKVFVGYNSFSYSPYTLSGHQFCGVGVEVTPPDFPLGVSVVYGRLLKATELDTTANIPSYRRMGAGIKASLTFKKVSTTTSLFYAWDEQNSITPLPDSLGITPKENIAFSFEGNIQPISGLKIDLNIGNSVLTNDKFSAISSEQKYWGGIFPGRTSTSSFWAYKTSASYAIQSGTVGVGYERIQPNFQTLGTYYSTNDMENFTINTTSRLIDGKINISGNIGLQHDNLDDQKLFSNQRVVGSANISLVLSEKININGSFSSFNSFSNLRSVFDYVNSSSPYQNLDTLNYKQVNKSGMISSSYAFGEDSKKQSVSISLSGNQSVNSQSESTPDKNIFINTGLTYTLNLSDIGWSISSSVLANTNQTSIGRSNTFGPFVNISKSIKEPNIRIGLSCAYNQSYLERETQNTNYNFRLNGSWSSKQGHSLSFASGFFNLIPGDQDLQGRKELTFNITYSYKFGLKFSPNKKEEKLNDTKSNEE